MLFGVVVGNTSVNWLFWQQQHTMRTSQPPREQSESPETHKNGEHTDNSPPPHASCDQNTAVDSKRKHTAEEGESARTRAYKFGRRYPTTGRNERPERWWETDPNVIWTHHPGSRSREKARNKKKASQATQPN